jgi:type I restriction enzyme S subunit
VDAKYLYYFVSSQAFRKEAAGHMTGAVGLRRVPAAFLADAQLPLVPLDEQRRIVAEIEKQFSRLDEAIANLQRVKANLKRYKASVLKAAVEGHLVGGDAAMAKAHEKGKWLPISLAIKSLDQGWSPQCENEPRTVAQEWAVMRTTAVQEMQFLPDENKRLPVGLEPRSQLELMGGDLLITRAGPRNRVGITCLVKASPTRLMLCDKAYYRKYLLAKHMSR